MVQYRLAAALPLVVSVSQCLAQGTGGTCPDTDTGSEYTADFKVLGCYNDSSVSILQDLKLSTIAMTPQFCADFCGERGYAYGGIDFGTQCFCGPEPNFDNANKIADEDCSPCFTDPSVLCGGGYLQSLLQIGNPQEVGDGSSANAFVPACQLSPLCSTSVCDTSLSISDRVNALINELTTEEKILNVVDATAGAERIGLPPYEYWSEATHGVGSAPGVQFPPAPLDYYYATSFPAPISLAASFDDPMILAIGNTVGREGRAFGNGGFAGFDYWAPNMNPFRDPRWGRGQETPGEDILVVQNYIRNYVTGLQGDDVNDKQVIATCKHYAAYDLETGRYGNNYNPTQQDLADYFLAPFKTCVKDVDVGSIMCSYNAVGGYPSCASEYLLQEVLRDHWNFTADYHYVVGDCGAVGNIYDPHNFTDSAEAAASVALNAGTDLDCGSTFLQLNESLADGQTTVERLDGALHRLYSALFTVGFFDGSQRYGTLNFSDVGTPEANRLAYDAAVKGMTLLKNDGLLPLNDANTAINVAVIGPFANATDQMQGTYAGPPKDLISPLYAFNHYDIWNVTYVNGTDIDTNDTSSFAAAIAAAGEADVVLYLGGIDTSLERETLDRTSIAWPGNQLDLITQLADVAAKMVVVQFGGGQVDDSVILSNDKINSLIWAGLPSQDGGTAVLDVLTGKQSIAGRLPITQYPASYADEVSIFTIDLRPNDTFPGRTYRFYTGEAVLPFGYGLHYTTFDFAWSFELEQSYDIANLVDTCKSATHSPADENTPWTTLTASITNTGDLSSDYVGLLFLSSTNAGPAPYPNKTLVSYERIHDLAADGMAELSVPLTLGSLARSDAEGAMTIWPGYYTLALDVDAKISIDFTLTGEPFVLDTLPKPKESYEFTVPVHVQPPSTEDHGT